MLKFVAHLRAYIQVDAGQVKTDRKIDILSRTIATPAVERIAKRPLKAGQSYLESTPEIDMDSASSADVSFESAIDKSLIEGSVSPLSFRPRISDVTDPFVTQSPLRREAFLDASETEEEEGEDVEETDEDEETEEDEDTEEEEDLEEEEVIEAEKVFTTDKVSSASELLDHANQSLIRPPSLISNPALTCLQKGVLFPFSMTARTRTVMSPV